MITRSNTSNQDISITLPLRIDFVAIENLLKKKFIDTNISKTDNKGKKTNYFKILNLNLAESQTKPYNLALHINLQTLTFLFHKKELELTVRAFLKFDVETQKLYVETYRINTSGESWLANHILDSVLNTFIYKKIIQSLSVELMPIIKEKIDLVNTKLSAKFETTKGISILGQIENFTISHIEIKKEEVWVFINTIGWCVIAIEDLDV